MPGLLRRLKLGKAAATATDAAGVERPLGDWRSAAAMPRALPAPVWVASPRDFVAQLPTRWQVPPALGRLAHEASTAAPRGIVSSGAPVAGYAVPQRLLASSPMRGAGGDSGVAGARAPWSAGGSVPVRRDDEAGRTPTTAPVAEEATPERSSLLSLPAVPRDPASGPTSSGSAPPTPLARSVLGRLLPRRFGTPPAGTSPLAPPRFLPPWVSGRGRGRRVTPTSTEATPTEVVSVPATPATTDAPRARPVGGGRLTVSLRAPGASTPTSIRRQEVAARPEEPAQSQVMGRARSAEGSATQSAAGSDAPVARELTAPVLAGTSGETLSRTGAQTVCPRPDAARHDAVLPTTRRPDEPSAAPLVGATRSPRPTEAPPAGPTTTGVHARPSAMPDASRLAESHENPAAELHVHQARLAPRAPRTEPSTPLTLPILSRRPAIGRLTTPAPMTPTPATPARPPAPTYTPPQTPRAQPTRQPDAPTATPSYVRELQAARRGGPWTSTLSGSAPDPAERGNEMTAPAVPASAEAPMPPAVPEGAGSWHKALARESVPIASGESGGTAYPTGPLADADHPSPPTSPDVPAFMQRPRGRRTGRVGPPSAVPAADSADSAVPEWRVRGGARLGEALPGARVESHHHADVGTGEAAGFFPEPVQTADRTVEAAPLPATRGDDRADDLSAELYDRIRDRLRGELLVDRERASMLTDLG